MNDSQEHSLKRDALDLHASRFTFFRSNRVHRLLGHITCRPVLLVWLLSVPAITPLLQPTLTRSADGLLHLYRLVALDHAIRQGVFFPRWLPDLAYGYGLPLFVFYAPLSYYISVGLNLLGMGSAAALNASFALAMLISGAGVYLFVKDLLGPKAGVLAGVAYVYAPYPLYNILWRGSLPIAWAGAVFPFAFWSFSRLIRTGKLIYLPLSALICGAALLTHNVSSLTFLPLLLFYLFLELLIDHRDKRLWLKVGLALILGLGLATFFLGPAILEKEFAQVERVITPPDFDYHFNFVDVGDLFRLPPPANTGLLNPDQPFTLGPVHLGLAALGLFSLLRLHLKDREKAPRSSAIATFTVIALAITVFMTLSISTIIWDSLPLIAFIQQPHRLLSLTAFLLAILAGAAVTLQNGRVGLSLTLIGMGLIFVTAVPLLYPRYYQPLPAPPTLAGMMNYEHTSGAIGTTSFGEYLPIWVKQIPRESPLEPMYQAGSPIERLDPAYLPAGAEIESAIYGFNQVELILNAPEPYQAIFHTFYFPGWQAQLDGRPVDLAPVSERGLIGLSVPAGRHHLHLQFRETPIRLLANSLSALALIITIAITLYTWRSPLPTPRSPLPALRSPPSALHFLSIAILAIILIILKTLYLDRYDNPLKHVFDGTHVAGAGVSRRVNFGHQVNLLGYDLEKTTVTAGQSFELTAYWQARQPLITNYSALAQLVDDQGHLYAGQDNLHPGNLPTTRWEPWGFTQDRHVIQIPIGTPPGHYLLIIGLYDPTTWVRLPVIEGGDPAWRDVIAIPVTVQKPVNTPAVADLDIKWPITASFTPSLRLLGATPERDVILRNDFLRVALFWQAFSVPEADYQVNLRLVTTGDKVVLQETTHPSHNRYPMTRWSAGELVRDNHALWIPADLPVRSYRLQVRLVDQAEQAVGEWVELGALKVQE